MFFEIGCMLNRMIDMSASFCGKAASLVKEDVTEYFISK